MAHLLHIDSSINGEHSVSHQLTRQAAEHWLRANPGGTVTYRDLAADPLPLLTSTAQQARYLPAEQHTPAQATAHKLSRTLTDEVKAADHVLLGLPLYNYAAPASVKTWVDHLVYPGLSQDPVEGVGLLGGRRFTVLAARGGGYGEGTPRAGWDHATPWLEHVLSTLGLEVEVIAAELTLAESVPAMAELLPLARDSRAAAEQAIEELFAADTAVAA